MGTGLRRHRGHTGQKEGASLRPRPHGVQAVVQSSAWTGHGAQGSRPPPHRLSASLLSSHRLGWCGWGSSPRAGGSGDRWLTKLQAQSSGESDVARGGNEPHQGPDQIPLGKWGRKIRLQRGILAISKIYELETKNLSARQIHQSEQPPELLPASPSGPKGGLDPEWGIRGLVAKEEHEPLDSHGLSGCRIQAPSHLIPSAALPA